MQFVFRQITKVVPAVEVYERQHVSHDDATVAWMTRDQLAIPFRIQKILPSLRRVFFRNNFWVVRDDRKRRPHAIVKARLILKAAGETSDTLGREFQQHPFVL